MQANKNDHVAQETNVSNSLNPYVNLSNKEIVFDLKNALITTGKFSTPHAHLRFCLYMAENVSLRFLPTAMSIETLV